MPARIYSTWLFPTPTGRMWRINNFYRDASRSAQRASELKSTPEDFRHSHVSSLTLAGIDLASRRSARPSAEPPGLILVA